MATSECLIQVFPSDIPYNKPNSSHRDTKLCGKHRSHAPTIGLPNSAYLLIGQLSIARPFSASNTFWVNLKAVAVLGCHVPHVIQWGA